MKNLYIIGGTMGVGKTTTCQALNHMLDNSVFLDGDWCWDMHPFKVTEETKKMVVENICCLLNNFIKCTEYENIIFCWVLHKNEIINDILSRLDTHDCDIKNISLVCSKDALIERLNKDISFGIRTAEVIEKSIQRIPLYDSVDSIKIDISDISPKQAAYDISLL